MIPDPLVISLELTIFDHHTGHADVMLADSTVVEELQVIHAKLMAIVA